MPLLEFGFLCALQAHIIWQALEIEGLKVSYHAFHMNELVLEQVIDNLAANMESMVTSIEAVLRSAQNDATGMRSSGRLLDR